MSAVGADPHLLSVQQASDPSHRYASPPRPIEFGVALKTVQAAVATLVADGLLERALARSFLHLIKERTA
jgi:hypothetical protein